MKCDFNCNLVHSDLKIVKLDDSRRQVPTLLHIWKGLIRTDF